MYHLTKKGKGLFSMSLYKGQIINQKRNGFGIQLFPNGCAYVGFWKDNEPEGKGKLIIKDGTTYEGQYNKGFISKGIIRYYNGANYEGDFDGTPFERLKQGIFEFSNKIILKANWKDGIIINGVLFDNNKEVANLDKEPVIIYSKSNNGVIISKKNKWIYEGGIKDNRCFGMGVIYCTFQQYKSGRFVNDKINGESYKMSINWGEITEGECEMDLKIGNWIRLLNKGYQVNYKVNEKEVKVTFPFLNNDYYFGSVIFDTKKYGLNFQKGIYYLNKKDESFDKIEIKNVDEIFLLPQVKSKGFSFQFTFDKVFENNLLLNSLKSYLMKLMVEKTISNKIYNTYFRDIFKEDLNSLNFTELQNSYVKNDQTMMFKTKTDETVQIVKSTVRSKLPPMKKKTRAITPNIKVCDNRKNLKTIDKKKTLEYNDFLDIKKNGNDIMEKEFLESGSDKLLESLVFNTSDDVTNVFKKNISKTQDTVKKMHHTNNLTFDVPITNKDQTKNFKKIEKFDSPLQLTENNSKANINDQKKSMITLNSIKFDKIESENEDSLSATQNKKKKSFLFAQPSKNETPLLEDPIEFFEGITKRGKFTGFCQVLYKSGLYIEGNFHEGVLKGKGFMILTNGIEYRGYFDNGLLSGDGTIIIENKEYHGIFIEGAFQNKEIITGIDNTHFLFKNNVDRKNKSGMVNIYFKNNYKLVNCIIDKNQLLNEKCTIYNKEGEYWIGKIQKKKGYYNFESLTGTKRTFHIFLENQGFVQMYL